MAKIIIDGALVGFLKSKGENVFSNFVDNTVLALDKTRSDVTVLCILEGFVWEDSPQGHKYWDRLYLESLKSKKREHEPYTIDLK